MTSKFTKILQNIGKHDKANQDFAPKKPEIRVLAVKPEPLIIEANSKAVISPPHSPTRPSPFLRRQSALLKKAPSVTSSSSPSSSSDGKENDLIQKANKTKEKENNSISDLEKSLSGGGLRSPTQTGDRFSMATLAVRPEELRSLGKTSENALANQPRITFINTLDHLTPPNLREIPSTTKTAVFREELSPENMKRRASGFLNIMGNSYQLQKNNSQIDSGHNNVLSTDGQIQVEARKASVQMNLARRVSKTFIPNFAKRNSFNLGKRPSNRFPKNFLDMSLSLQKQKKDDPVINMKRVLSERKDDEEVKDQHHLKDGFRIRTPEQVKPEVFSLSITLNSSIYSPRVAGLKPKYFHNLTQTRVSTTATNSSRSRNIIKKNCTISTEKKNKTSKSKYEKKEGKNGNGFSYGHVLVSLLKSKDDHAKTFHERTPVSHTSTVLNFSLNKRKETYDFYIDLLRKLELIKFNMKTAGKREEKITESNYDIEIETLKYVDDSDMQALRVFSAKIGTDYFVMLKKVFNHYSDDKVGSLAKLMTFRKMTKFCEDFQFFKSFLDKQAFQVLFYKVLPSKRCNFQGFIELLYKMQGIFFRKLGKKPIPKEKEEALKLFLDEAFIPIYKANFLKIYSPHIERIQVFYQNYNPYENPTVCLLYENDNLLKHLFSLYELYDIKVSNHSFVDLKQFLKFCTDFDIIPYLCSMHQITKVFRVYQNGIQGVIGFNHFVIILGCLAHIAPGNNEIYVRNNRHNRVYITRIHKLFDKNLKEAVLHGMGPAALKCIKIALFIQGYYSNIDFEVQTSSEPTIIDVETAEGDEKTELRNRSAIHIKIKRKIDL